MTSPLLLAGLGIVFVIAAIAWARLHAFFALVLAALLVAVLGVAGGLIEGSYAAAVEVVMTEVGVTAGKIAFVIVAAAVIGDCMTASGAAGRIVDGLLRLFGEKRAPLALVVAGFILSVPVFFDTVFILLLPLARELARRQGGTYVHYLLAICAGAVVTHSTVPPTPGPLLLAEMLELDLAFAIVGGAAVGLPLAVVGLVLARVLGRRMTVSPDGVGAAPAQDPIAPPPLFLALLPVVSPLVLIAAATVAAQLAAGAEVHPLIDFLGNKNIALLVALGFSLVLVLRGRRLQWRELSPLMGRALETAGAIVLITSAGGAFGTMIKLVGVADSVKAMTDGAAFDVVLLAWVLAAIVRVAQGSATVAIITTGGIMMSLGPEALGGTHIFYVYLAIGYGSFFCSWMNDSGFWLVSRFGGLTEREALRSWTLLSIGVSVTGLAFAWVLSRLVPLG